VAWLKIIGETLHSRFMCLDQISPRAVRTIGML